MEKIIYDRLKSQVRDTKKRYFEKNKKQYIDKVLLTIEAISNLRSFNDLLELVSGIFTYRYTNIEGQSNLGVSKVHSSLDETKVFYLGWVIDRSQHRYIADINIYGRILTWDSYNATKFNKSGLSGIIQGKYLIQLENYIRDTCSNSFTMVSNKILRTEKEVDAIMDLFEKYDVRQPFYRIDGHWDSESESFIKDNGYGYIYGTGYLSFISYDTILDMICDFDRDILKNAKISIAKIRNELKKSLMKEDLRALSFLGNRLNDNSMFRLLSEFRPSD